MSKKSSAKSRAQNTHDDRKSQSQLEGALIAANRELVNANDRLMKGHGRESLKMIVLAAYWTGRARAEASYARPSASDTKRLNELEDRMRGWGDDFLKWQKENG